MNHEQILQKFYEAHAEWNVRANDRILIDQACDNGCSPLTIEGLERAVYKLGSRLAMAQPFADALTDFYTRHPEYAGVAANTGVLLSLWGGCEPSVEAFEEVAGRESSPLTTNLAAQAASRDAEERQRLISEIAQGRDVYSARNNQGKAILYPVSELYALTTARLQEVEQLISEQRRFLAADPKEIRKEINHTMKEAWHQARANDTPPMPTHYTVTVANQHFKQGETIELTVKNFKRLDKSDIRRIWLKHGSDNLDAFLGVKRQPVVGERSNFSL